MSQQKLVKINLLGILGEQIGCSSYKLAIKTCGQAFNAIEVLSKRKFYKQLLENDKRGIKYKILINNRPFLCEKTPTIDDPDSIKNSELMAKIHNLKEISIVPVLEGSGSGGDSGSIWAIVIGAVLIVVGIILQFVPGGQPFGVVAIIAGIGLIAAGVINLLSKGPELQEFTQRQKTSYLFTGPTNTVNEGGPVPVGYGRLLIGSSVISASYDIEYFNADDPDRLT